MSKLKLAVAAAISIAARMLPAALMGHRRVKDWKHNQERLNQAEEKRKRKAERNIRNSNN